jgi:hypothetical protein
VNIGLYFGHYPDRDQLGHFLIAVLQSSKRRGKVQDFFDDVVNGLHTCAVSPIDAILLPKK